MCPAKTDEPIKMSLHLWILGAQGTTVHYMGAIDPPVGSGTLGVILNLLAVGTFNLACYRTGARQLITTKLM